MSAIKNGGSAFPMHNAIGASAPGMSLRDWFAGQALTGLCANSIPGDHHRPKARVSEAYALADAMLSERERGQ